MKETIFEGKDLELIRGISKVANAFGYNVYLVGGIVRDLLLDKPPKDIDIVVVGNAFTLTPMLKEKFLCKVVKSQPELKTVRLAFGDSMEIDFASTRRELYGIKKGIPIASHFGCPLKDDVIRRDFTVNAIAISINSNDYGRILDFVNGKKDLENKVLRVLHDNSFNDDPTRIIRAFKFAHRLGFTIEEHTQKLIDEYLENKDYSEVVSPMRIKKEFDEVFSTNSAEVMEDFINKKIYKVFSDKINNVDFKQIKDTIEKNHIEEENIPFIYFMCLFFRKENYGLIKQFDLTRQQIKMIQDLKFAEELEGKFSDLEIYQQYSNRTKESLALELLIKNNTNIKKYLEKLNNVKIEITGDDLILMGIPESKSYSTIFNRVLEEKINGNLPDKTSELRFVRKLLLNNEV